MKHRTPDKIKFLNVVQGRNYTEAKKWYDAVKDYDFEGWSFAGPCAGDPAITVKLILNLWKDGKLNENQNWLHILGKSRLDAVWTNNIIHRCIRRHISPNAQVSYDSASAYLMAAYGQIWHNHQIDYKSMKFLPIPAPNDKALANSKAMFPWINKLTKNLRMNEFCQETKQIVLSNDDYEPDFVDLLELNVKGDISASDENFKLLQNYGAIKVDSTGELAKNNKSYCITESNNFIDSHAYAILMYHNTIIQMRAIEAINKMSEFPVESMRGRLPKIHIQFKEEVEQLFELFAKDPSVRTDAWIEAYKGLDKFKTLIDGSGEGGDGDTKTLFEMVYDDENDGIKAPPPPKKLSFGDELKKNPLNEDLWDAPEILEFDKKIVEFVDNRGNSGKKSAIDEIKQSVGQSVGVTGLKKSKTRK